MKAPHALLRHFTYAHLPPHLAEVSLWFAQVAHRMDEQLPDGLEKDAGLRKLLEAKDCAVRAMIP